MPIRAAAILLLCSVLLLFFVPADVGPFSAVHGPVTALRANRAAQVFYFRLALSARNPVTALVFGSFDAPCSVTSRSIFMDTEPSAPLSALRC